MTNKYGLLNKIFYSNIRDRLQKTLKYLKFSNLKNISLIRSNDITMAQY